MKIVVINQPMGNRGDESAHRAMMKKISDSFPEASIEMVSFGYSPSVVADIKVSRPNVKYTIIEPYLNGTMFLQKAYKYSIIYLLYLNPSTRLLVNRIKSADIIVCAPGGICLGGFQNWRHLEQLLVAKYYKKPILYFGRSIGPFPLNTKENRFFYKKSKEVLSYMTYISLRDSESLRIAKELCVTAVKTVDTAFLDSPKAKIPVRIQNVIGDEEYMVFVPNKLTWHFRYSKIQQSTIDSFYIRIIEYILKIDKQIKIVFLPQLHTYSRSDDKYYFCELLEKIGNNRLLVIDDIYGSDIQQAIIANSKYVIGARYHSIVFSINNAVPFIALSYEHKMKGLLNNLGTENDERVGLVDITNIFVDEKAVESTLLRIQNIIKQINNDRTECIKYQQRAKQISNNAFEEFKNSISYRH